MAYDLGLTPGEIQALLAKQALQPGVEEPDHSHDEQELRPYVDVVNDVVEHSSSNNKEENKLFPFLGEIFHGLFPTMEKYFPKPMVDAAKKGVEAAVEFKNHIFKADNVKIPKDAQERIRVAVSFFEQKGWSHAQAIGIVANMFHESGMNEKAIGDGHLAVGLTQVHPDRQRAIEAHFNLGKPYKDYTFTEMLEGAHYELTEGGEKHAGNLLRQAKTAYEAGAIVSAKFERPAARQHEMETRGATAASLETRLVPTVGHNPAYASLGTTSTAGSSPDRHSPSPVHGRPAPAHA